jgi:hypothetical protein
LSGKTGGTTSAITSPLPGNIDLLRLFKSLLFVPLSINFRFLFP